MYNFIGNLEDPSRYARLKDGYLVKLLNNRLKRLEKWYAYIQRNKKLGSSLSVLFGALELVIVELVRFSSRFMPSAGPRFMRAIDGKWGSKIIPLNVDLGDVTPAVLPSQQVLEIARRVPIRSLNWCYCHHTYGKKAPGEKDRYTCLAMGWGQNLAAIDSLAKHHSTDKVGKILTYEQVENKLKEWNEQGFVHQLIYFPSPDYFYIICACHPGFCLTLSNMKKWGFPAVVKSDFIAERNPDLCKQCKTCVSRCHFNAMVVNEDGAVVFDANKCAGCGLCVTKCPAGAIKLVPRQPGRGTR